MRGASLANRIVPVLTEVPLKNMRDLSSRVIMSEK